ncbi:hypothetical protein [Vibrio sp. D431a]|uniref:hypothetical protein n=1 Tax=Vibrio sp. D431a TaxID=2837388 RepID=UPI0025570D6F|nr:hypothetical protein [Vibrio sp. D431a]MDK9790050.1 hypothetical protein [Vibrio sp. D431a]
MPNIHLNKHIYLPNELDVIKTLKLEIKLNPSQSGTLEADLQGLCLSAVKGEDSLMTFSNVNADYILEISQILLEIDEKSNHSKAVCYFNTDIQDVRDEYCYDHNFNLPIDEVFKENFQSASLKFVMHFEDSDQEILERIESITLCSTDPNMPKVHQVTQGNW